MTGGLFIVIEGPNGVGKTTSAKLLAERLAELGSSVHLTAEPSRTPLGTVVRSGEANLTGRALALAVAADRYDHIVKEILPALAAGQIVVSDRYVQSSLVLQRLDGLGLAEIWRYNAHVRPPALSFYLQNTSAIIQARLNERQYLSRLEHAGSPAQEILLYDDAYRFLGHHRWRQAKIDCGDLEPGAVVKTMLNQIDLLRS